MSLARRLSAATFAAAALGAVALAFTPWVDRLLAARDAARLVAKTRAAIASAPAERITLACDGLTDARLLRLDGDAHVFASWANVAGCGASGGGASSTAGGAKWIGRGVTGGLIDLQCMASQTFVEGGAYTTINTRIATRYFEKWIFGFNVPLLYKAHDVTVLGKDRTAKIPGFGDMSLEITRKLGVTNSSLLSLSIGLPVGSYDAVREGIVLPQQAQLGSGVFSGSLLFEHSQDVDWGLMVLGATVSYGGWENDIGDFRPPSAAAYVYVGYLLGPLVPSAGLTGSVNLAHSRERGKELDVPLGLAVVNVGLEWSSDYVAVLLSGSMPFNAQGAQSGTVSLGVQTSLF